MTVREILTDIRNTVLENPAIDAYTASENLVKLTALLGNINDEITKWEEEYIEELNRLMDDDPKMGEGKLKIRAMRSDSFKNLQTAKRAGEVAQEMINGLKYRCRVMEREWRESKNI